MRFNVGGVPSPERDLYVPRGDAERRVWEALRAGSSVVVVGPSRAGKTTLSHWVETRLAEERGHAKVLRVDLRDALSPEGELEEARLARVLAELAERRGRADAPGLGERGSLRARFTAAVGALLDRDTTLIVDELNVVAGWPDARAWVEETVDGWAARSRATLVLSTWSLRDLVESGDAPMTDETGDRSSGGLSPLLAGLPSVRLPREAGQVDLDALAAALRQGRDEAREERPELLRLDEFVARGLAEQLVARCGPSLAILQLLGRALADGRLPESLEGEAAREAIVKRLSERNGLVPQSEAHLRELPPRLALAVLCWLTTRGKAPPPLGRQSPLFSSLFSLGFVDPQGEPVVSDVVRWAWDVAWCRRQLEGLERKLPYARRLFEWHATGALGSSEARPQDLDALDEQQHLFEAELAYRRALAAEVQRRVRATFVRWLTLLGMLVVVAAGYLVYQQSLLAERAATTSRARAEAAEQRAAAERQAAAAAAARAQAAEQARLRQEAEQRARDAAEGERLARERERQALIERALAAAGTGGQDRAQVAALERALEQGGAWSPEVQRRAAALARQLYNQRAYHAGEQRAAEAARDAALAALHRAEADRADAQRQRDAALAAQRQQVQQLQQQNQVLQQQVQQLQQQNQVLQQQVQQVQQLQQQNQQLQQQNQQLQQQNQQLQQQNQQLQQLQQLQQQNQQLQQQNQQLQQQNQQLQQQAQQQQQPR